MGLLLSGAQDHHEQKVSSINRDGLCPLLSDDQIRRLEAATAIALGYPHNLNSSSEQREAIPGGRFDQIDYPDPCRRLTRRRERMYNGNKRNRKMNGCCRITPEWSATLT
jgi:hypothetical protein